MKNILTVEAFRQDKYIAELDEGGVLHKELEAKPFQLAVGADVITLTIPRTGLPDTKENVIKCRAYISYDAGLNWEILIGFSTCGGDIGNTESGATIGLRQPGNPDRRVKCTMIPLQTISAKIDVAVYKS